MTTPPHVRRKNPSIESLRGLAVLLMVSGHVIGHLAGRGMQVAPDSGWRVYYLLLDDVRMPLFTVLSGYVYAYRPLRRLDGYRGLVRGKARRLLVPLLTVGLLLLVLQQVTPGTNSKVPLQDAWRTWVFGLGHLWFLQSIFLVFLVVGLLTGSGWLRSPARAAAVIGAGALLFVLVRVPDAVDVFSVSGAIRLLPFFVLGYALHTWGGAAPARTTVGVVLGVAAALFATRALVVAGVLDLGGATPLNRVLSMALGLATVTAVLLLREHLVVRPLAWLGGFSFGVYLLHVFGAAGSRLVLNRLGVYDEGAEFVIGVLCAVGLPVLAELLLGRYAWFSRGVLGQRPRRPRPAPVEAVALPR